MESPFYPNSNNTSSTFTLFLEPVLDSFSQKYIQIITLSCMPPGPLASLVKIMSFPKLSQFTYSFYNSNFGCSYVLTRYPNVSNTSKESTYMYSDDIPAVFSYLVINGYTIDKSFTKMMNGSRVLVGGVSNTRFSSDRRMICFVSYYTDQKEK